MHFHKAQEKPRLYGSFADRQYSIWQNLENIYGCDHKSEVLIMPLFWGLPCIDYSKFGNHGVNHGASFRDGSLDFDGGDDYVDCGNSLSLTSISSSFSVSVWANIDVLTRGDLASMWQTGVTNSKFNLLYGITSGKPQFWVTDGTAPGIKNSGTGASTMATGVWYYITGVYDDNADLVKVYLNGNFESSGIASINLNTVAIRKLWIGDNNAVDGTYTGIIDEVRISNIARSAETITLFHDRPWALYQRVGRTFWSIPAAGASYAPTGNIYGPFYGPLSGVI